MILTGTTVITVNGKITRICGSHFNAAVRSGKDMIVRLDTGDVVTPSKGLSWADVGAQIRHGHKVQASVGRNSKKRPSAPNLKIAA